jgi:hypothetical protein
MWNTATPVDGGTGRESSLSQYSKQSIALTTKKDTESGHLTSTTTKRVDEGGHNKDGNNTGTKAMDVEPINTKKKRSHSEDMSDNNQTGEKTDKAARTMKMNFEHDSTKIGAYTNITTAEKQQMIKNRGEAIV